MKLGFLSCGGGQFLRVSQCLDDPSEWGLACLWLSTHQCTPGLAFFFPHIPVRFFSGTSRVLPQKGLEHSRLSLRLCYSFVVDRLPL